MNKSQGDIIDPGEARCPACKPYEEVRRAVEVIVQELIQFIQACDSFNDDIGQ